MKKLLALLLAATMLLSLAACGEPEETTSKESNSATGTAADSTAASQESTKPTESIPEETDPTEPAPTQPKPTEPVLSSSEGLEFSLSRDKTSYAVKGIGTCTDTNIVIPAEYQGLPVTSIASQVFRECSCLVNITIPESVTSIGNSAFYECSSLVNITIPESVTSIGPCAFSNCGKLTDIYYGGTQEQWAAAIEGQEVGGNFTIHCTDGEIKI